MNTFVLKSQMALNGKSQKDMAEQCGITTGTFSKKINGKREFTQGEISAIAQTLKLTREQICDIFFAEKVS